MDFSGLNTILIVPLILLIGIPVSMYWKNKFLKASNGLGNKNRNQSIYEMLYFFLIYILIVFFLLYLIFLIDNESI